MAEVPTRVEHPTFETVWAALQENAQQLREFRESQRESHEKFMREIEESNKRRDEENKRREREMEKSHEKFRREMKESSDRLNKQLGKLGNRFGEMVEYMVVPNLITKFKKLGFVFEKAYMDAEIKDETHNIFTEVDITLENGDKVMIVEVKSKPTTENVTEHVKRMEKVRRHGDFHGDRRVYLGAIAGMVFQDDVKRFALKTGFYAIEPSGETFVITAPSGDCSPREWQQTSD